jgi:hypothetical protein
MASKKKLSEGIALLSIYKEEEDKDMEDLKEKEIERTRGKKAIRRLHRFENGGGRRFNRH